MIILFIIITTVSISVLKISNFLPSLRTKDPKKSPRGSHLLLLQGVRVLLMSVKDVVPMAVTMGAMLITWGIEDYPQLI